MLNKRVMVIDPNLYNRMVLNNILVTNGYTVCCELSKGTDALEQYEKVQPDLVLVDAMIPDKDCVAFIKELCNKHKECLALLLASAGQRSQVCAALDAGAVDFIAKPLNERRVLITLKKVS